MAASADALDLKVSADAGGMRVFVQPGFAIVRGFAYTSDAVEMLAIATANTTERIDSVVLRLNPSTNSISLVVLTGTPGAGAPALTQTDTGVYEFLLGTVTVAGSVTAIGPSAVTDARQFTGNGVGCWTTATRPSSPRKDASVSTPRSTPWVVERLGLEADPGDDPVDLSDRRAHDVPALGHTHDDVYWQKSGRATLTFSSESSKSITVSAPFPIDDPSLVHISLTKLTGSGSCDCAHPAGHRHHHVRLHVRSVPRQRNGHLRHVHRDVAHDPPRLLGRVMDSDIIIALVTAGFALVGAIGVELIRRHSQTAADIAITREQVQNSHTTNLREDIDELHADVRRVLTELTEVRKDLQVERQERLALSDRLDKHKHAA